MKNDRCSINVCLRVVSGVGIFSGLLMLLLLWIRTNHYLETPCFLNKYSHDNQTLLVNLPRFNQSDWVSTKKVDCNMKECRTIIFNHRPVICLITNKDHRIDKVGYQSDNDDIVSLTHYSIDFIIVGIICGMISGISYLFELLIKKSENRYNSLD